MEAGIADYVGEIPTILKLNIQDLLHMEKEPLGARTCPVSEALRLGCVDIGYTIFPRTAEQRQQYEQLQELVMELCACGLVVVVWSNPPGGSLSKEGETALDVVAYGARKVPLLPIRLGVYPSPLIQLIQTMVARLSWHREHSWEVIPMARDLKVGDHVEWNSEAGRVRGTIKKKITSEIKFKGYTVHASKEEPQYLIKSDKTEHLAMHKGSALKKIIRRKG